MPEFKFKVGDMAYHRVGIQESMNAARLGSLRSPNAVVVIQQHAITCSGGTQLLYSLSGKDALVVHENELAALSEWDVDAMLSLFIAAGDTLKASCTSSDTDE